MRRIPTTALMAGAFLAAMLLAPCSCHSAGQPQAKARGEALFERQCAGCHGARGDGDSPVANLLFPRPRAFRDGVFKLVSSDNGVPTDEDLVAMLRRGMPGSSMPAYDWLGEEDLALLAAHVRRLAQDGMAAQLQLRAAALGVAVSADEVRDEAARRLRPGHGVAVPAAAAAPTEASRAQGQLVYQRHCAACHGQDGTGRTPDPDWAGASEAVWARDFTAGFLRGSGDRSSLLRRALAGIPGAGMPPCDLSDVEANALGDYLQALVADGSDGHHVQWRRTLRAPRLAELPVHPEDIAWSDVEAVRIPLAPLWWRKDAVFEVWVRVAHDGERLACWLSWPDATRDDRASEGAFQGDGAAVQWTVDQEPPLFAMGGSEGVEIWHWKAFRPADVAGGLDLLSRLGRTGADASLDLPGVLSPSRRGETLSVHGPFGMTQERGLGRAIATVPVFRDGRWTVTMTRGLQAQRGGEVSLQPGQRALLAFAVWDGSIDPHAGSKSVSTWHWVQLLR